ncbi:MAG: hypothetical protein OEY23_20840 [Acidimicrobiia bacterium]|nr:hypothetical protein [Acidimicrobiia bacterium]
MDGNALRHFAAVLLGAVAAMVLAACGRDSGAAAPLPPAAQQAPVTATAPTSPWEFMAMSGALEVEHYDSLAEMIGAADVVVVARPTGAIQTEAVDDTGRVSGPDSIGPTAVPDGHGRLPAPASVAPTTVASRPPTADGLTTRLMSFRIEQQLKGDVRAGELIELSQFAGGPASDSPTNVPDDQLLLVLRRRADTGGLRLVNSRGLILDQAGVAAFPLVVAEDRDLDALVRAVEGRRFDEVVDEVVAE